ncbi:MAG: immunoglobulin-like domain-containing protein [Lachnospiraceae bacterium]|nr:immunoglobulin-like domain-containing protein [Lachnospiraceae bacterium]
MKKQKYCVLMVAAGCLISLLLMIQDGEKEVLRDGRYIYRNEAGKGEQTVWLSAESEDGKLAETELRIQENRYSEAELSVLYEKLLKELPEIVLGDNASWDRVSEDLYLPERMSAYPFTLTWSSDNPQILSESGTLLRQSSVSVSLTLTVSYYSFERVVNFPVTVAEKPPEYEEVVERTAEQAEEASRGENVITLPEEINGEKVVWKTKRKGGNLWAAGLGIGAALFYWFGTEWQQKKEREKKIAVMEEEYPAIVNKLTLYLGAGLSIGNSWKKIAEKGYGKNPVYEEMLYASREIEGGVSEAAAFENFGKRVGQKHYVKLTALLTQSLQKGNTQLFNTLRQEVTALSEERSASSRRKGEEASTRLLFPMMLMLAMTMVLIMYPAFLAF